MSALLESLAEQFRGILTAEDETVETAVMAESGVDLVVRIAPEQIEAAAQVADAAGLALDGIAGVDWPEEGQLELLYDFMHFAQPARLLVRTRVPREQAVIASLSAIYPGANWHEREAAEFYGITFSAHPNPIHLLLPEDFKGYPLRKDFKAQLDPV